MLCRETPIPVPFSPVCSRPIRAQSFSATCTLTHRLRGAQTPTVVTLWGFAWTPTTRNSEFRRSGTPLGRYVSPYVRCLRMSAVAHGAHTVALRKQLTTPDDALRPLLTMPCGCSHVQSVSFLVPGFSKTSSKKDVMDDQIVQEVCEEVCPRYGRTVVSSEEETEAEASKKPPQPANRVHVGMAACVSVSECSSDAWRRHPSLCDPNVLTPPLRRRRQEISAFTTLNSKMLSTRTLADGNSCTPYFQSCCLGRIRPGSR